MNRTSLVGHVLEICELIDESTRPADVILSEFFRARKYLGSTDRRFISETMFGMIRNRRFIETLLESYIDTAPEPVELNAKTYRYLPLYSVFQLVVQKESKESLISSIEARWKTLFPNRMLAEFADWIEVNQSLSFLQSESYIEHGVRYSFQDWMVKAWQDQFGDEIQALLKVLNEPAPITLRVNTLKMSREECRLRLEQEGIVTTPTKYSPAGLIASKRFNRQVSPSFKEGLFEMQDEGSQLISILMAPEQGMVIVDACAGAGGKTLHLAELMKNDGMILALDTDTRRLQELVTRVQRAGVTMVTTMLADQVNVKEYDGKADIVLVDAPCSGSGTLRRNPMLKWRIAEDHLERYSLLQRELLERNVQFVKPNGRLVYVTCSLFDRENSEVVNSFLEKHADFELLPIQHEIQIPVTKPKNKSMALLPHIHSTDGFFMAVMGRVK